jgi:hypothetical protein
MQVSLASSINSRLAKRLTKEPTWLLIRIPMPSYSQARGELKYRVEITEELGFQS